MTVQETSGRNRVRLCPPPPKDFDPFTATVEDLKRHGLPLRPDPQTQPGMAALWERKARRYRNFEHLKPAVRSRSGGQDAGHPGSAFGVFLPVPLGVVRLRVRQFRARHCLVPHLDGARPAVYP